jgi:DNA polymerase III epsilon subunit family exonuclease
MDVQGAWSVIKQLAADTATYADNPATARTKTAWKPRAQPDPELPGSGPYAVIDVETTGFSPQRDRIVEIAIVLVSAQGTVDEVWSTLINPDQSTGPSHIHGITNTDVRNAPRFKDVLPEIDRQLAGATVVAHNVDFDLGFLASEFRRAGATNHEWPSMCTMQLTKRYFPGESASLAGICKRLNIEIGEAHTATADALAAARLLSIYITRNQQYSVPTPTR